MQWTGLRRIVGEWFLKEREVLQPDSAKLLGKSEGDASTARFGRRRFLAGGFAAAVAARGRASRGQTQVSASSTTASALTIDAVELIELHGRYTEEAGVDSQPQVNPRDVYDDLSPQPYQDQPSG